MSSGVAIGPAGSKAAVSPLTEVRKGKGQGEHRVLLRWVTAGAPLASEGRRGSASSCASQQRLKRPTPAPSITQAGWPPHAVSTNQQPAPSRPAGSPAGFAARPGAGEGVKSPGPAEQAKERLPA